MRVILLGEPRAVSSLAQLVESLAVDVDISLAGALHEVPAQLAGRELECDVVFVVADELAEVNRVVIRQLHASHRCPIALLGRAADPSTMLSYIRAGASDFLDICGDFATELEQLIERVQSSPQYRHSLGQQVAFVAASGGCGITTLAANAAIELARRGKRITAVDINLHGGDLAAHLGLEPDHDLRDCAFGQSSLGRSAVSLALTKHESGLRLLASPDYLEAIEGMQQADLARTLRTLASMNDLIVIDAGNVTLPAQAESVLHVDRLCVVFRLEFSSLVRTKRLLDHLQHFEVSPENIWLIANRTGVGITITPSRAEAALKRPIEYCLPDDPRTCTTSLDVGIPAVCEAPRSKFAKSMQPIVEAILRLNSQITRTNYASIQTA